MKINARVWRSDPRPQGSRDEGMSDPTAESSSSSLSSSPSPTPHDRPDLVADAQENDARYLLDPDLTEPPEWNTRAGRRNMREKTAAGLRGLKFAMRGDSSFFAHAYRGLIIVLAAALLGVPPMAWCLLVLAIVMVLVAELTNSAIDTLARALGDPEEMGLTVAREIATAAVLVAVVTQGAVVTTIFVLRMGDLFGWF
jgi:diacylglycerol kinase (ATP)